jgi:hypothetical protein
MTIRSSDYFVNSVITQLPITSPMSPSNRLVILVLLTLGGYVLLWRWFPLAPYYRQLPLLDIRAFSPSLRAGLAYGLLLLTLYGLYLAAYRLVRQMPSPPRLWLILGTAVLLSLPLLQTYPINATDLFRYWLHGRITSLYQANTYTAAPGDFPDDPYLPLAGEWADESSPYGPVWEMLAASVAYLTPYELYAGLMGFKLVGLAAFLLCSWLIWLLLAEDTPDRRAGYTLLWAWNPALLLTFVMDAHNDVLMLFWLLLGLWVIRRGQPTAGISLMLLAALTKPVALLPIPFFFLACWQDSRERWRLLLGTAVTTLLLIFVTFLPFGSPLPLLSRLARESAAYPGFSPLTVVLLLIQEMGALTAVHLQTVANIGRLLFLLVAGWLAWRTWHGRNPLRAAADIFFTYLLTAPAFRIWYAAWPFPWLLLEEMRGGGDEVMRSGGNEENSSSPHHLITSLPPARRPLLSPHQPTFGCHLRPFARLCSGWQ